MNKINLIRLGAFAQTVFNMQPGFAVIEIPSDGPHTYYVAYTQTSMGWEFIEKDAVFLQKYVIADGPIETIRMGYSVLANTLVIRETPQ